MRLPGSIQAPAKVSGASVENLSSLVVFGFARGASSIDRCVEHRAALEIAKAYIESLRPLR